MLRDPLAITDLKENICQQKLNSPLLRGGNMVVRTHCDVSTCGDTLRPSYVLTTNVPLYCKTHDAMDKYAARLTWKTSPPYPHSRSACIQRPVRPAGRPTDRPNGCPRNVSRGPVVVVLSPSPENRHLRPPHPNPAPPRPAGGSANKPLSQRWPTPRSPLGASARTALPGLCYICCEPRSLSSPAYAPVT